MLAIVIGRRRQGKSTLALALAAAAGQTTLIFDPNDQFGAIPRLDGPAAVPAWLTESGADAVARIVPSPPVEDAWAELADTLDGGEWRWADYTLILDECSMLMSPYQIDDRLERFARTAPRDVNVILTTHRPRDVHALFRALATDWFVFQTTIELDLKSLRDDFGPELPDRVQTLPPYHVAHYWLDAGGAPRLAVWDRPEEWFIEIGRRT